MRNIVALGHDLADWFMEGDFCSGAARYVVTGILSQSQIQSRMILIILITSSWFCPSPIAPATTQYKIGHWERNSWNSFLKLNVRRSSSEIVSGVFCLKFLAMASDSSFALEKNIPGAFQSIEKEKHTSREQTGKNDPENHQTPSTRCAWPSSTRSSSTLPWTEIIVGALDMHVLV